MCCTKSKINLFYIYTIPQDENFLVNDNIIKLSTKK